MGGREFDLTEPQKPPSIGNMAFSAGIFAGLIPVFWSLWSVALAQDDFWPPVSACKNSVPGGRISSGKCRRGRANAERTPGGRVIHLPVFPRRRD
jgi:hypothetical protein